MVDPTSFNQALTDAALFGQAAGSNAGWENLTNSGPSAFALPHPKNLIGDPDYNVDEIFTEDFFTGPVPPWGPNAGGQGTIKAAHIHDRGACARYAPLRRELRDALRQGWRSLYCSVDQFTSANPDGPFFGFQFIEHLNRHWMEAAWLLRHRAGDPSDLHGELLLNAQIRIDTQDYVPVTDIVARLVWKGEAVIEPGTGYVSVDGSYLRNEIDYTAFTFDPIVNQAYLAAVAALVAFDPAGEVNGVLRAQQTQAISATPEACQPLVPQESFCTLSRSALTSAINTGWFALRAQYGDDILSQDDLQDMLAVTTTPQVLAQRWSCELGPTPPGVPPPVPPPLPQYQCEFIVPAKRLNYLADGVDVVFFDGIEPRNPAFALWVGIQGLKAFPATAQAGTTAETAMCTLAIPQDQIGTFGGLQRPFASASLRPCLGCEQTEAACE